MTDFHQTSKEYTAKQSVFFAYSSETKGLERGRKQRVRLGRDAREEKGRLLGALIVTLMGYLCLLLENKLKVTLRLIPFLFGNRPYVTDFSMLGK